MEQRRLGQTPVMAGVIGMGTWKTFDVPPQRKDEVTRRVQIVDEAIEHGVTLFDSSPMYGDAEEVLALSLEGRRNAVVVATKVWSSSVDSGRAQIERALRLYGGTVDVYQVHNLVEWRRYLPLLVEMKQQGKVRAVGMTHYATSSFPEMMAIMRSQGIDMVQIPYDPLNRTAEREILPLAAERGIGVIGMSPLGTGRLVRRAPPDQEMAQFGPFGVSTWAQVLLKWAVSDPRVTCVIPATSRVGRMTENSAAGLPPFFGPGERDAVVRLAQRYVA